MELRFNYTFRLFAGADALMGHPEALGPPVQSSHPAYSALFQHPVMHSLLDPLAA